MSDIRKHPDIFTEEDAVAYLRVANPSARLMETLRGAHKLVSFTIGRERFYHRRHLDSLVERLAGMDMTPADAGEKAVAGDDENRMSIGRRVRGAVGR